MQKQRRVHNGSRKRNQHPTHHAGMKEKSAIPCSIQPIHPYVSLYPFHVQLSVAFNYPLLVVTMGRHLHVPRAMSAPLELASCTLLHWKDLLLVSRDYPYVCKYINIGLRVNGE